MNGGRCDVTVKYGACIASARDLIGMGVMPLQFEDGEGREELDLEGLEDGLEPNAELTVISSRSARARASDGEETGW